MTKALLNKLSLNAPRACVRNSGRKRLARSNSICLLIVRPSRSCDCSPDPVDDFVGGVRQGSRKPPIGAEGGGLDDRAHDHRRGEHWIEPPQLLPPHAFGEYVADDIDRVGGSR